MVSHKKITDNISQRDLKLIQLAEEIKKKKEFILKKRKELEKKEEFNEYLAIVKKDYDYYYEEELEKKKKELNAMSLLNDYMIYLENQNHLVNNQLIIAQYDKKHISKEINKIKKELNNLMDTNF
jgi:hypothetical protein